MNHSSNPQTGSSNVQSGAKNDVASATDAASNALKDGIVRGARDLSAEVTHVAGDVAKEAKKAAESKLDAGKDFAAEHLGAVAGALRETGRQLRQGDSGLTDYVEKAARSVDGVSTYLQTRTLSQLISDAEGYARREPAVFLGGAFFVGLLGGRFLKSATPAPVRANGNGNGNGQAHGQTAKSSPAVSHASTSSSPKGEGRGAVG